MTYTMGRAVSLTEDEKRSIIAVSKKKLSVTEISRKIKRSYYAVSKFLNDPFAKRTRRDKGKLKSISSKEMTKLKRACSRNPLGSSAQIFIDAGIPNVSKATRNRVLNKIAANVKPSKQPVLSKKHREKRLTWAEEYMKINFETVIFTDECRATLDGPDGWSRGWVRTGVPVPIRMRRQQGGGGVMIWAGIVNNTLIGPFRVPEGVKINSKTYIDFLKKNFMPWYRKQPLAFKRKTTFMQDGAPAHSAQLTKDFLEKMGFKGARLMKWPANSPDLNPIENLWAIVKRRVHANGRQFTSKDQLWTNIKEVCKQIQPQEILNLTLSVDKRLSPVVLKKGSHTGH